MSNINDIKIAGHAKIVSIGILISIPCEKEEAWGSKGADFIQAFNEVDCYMRDMGFEYGGSDSPIVFDKDTKTFNQVELFLKRDQ